MKEQRRDPSYQEDSEDSDNLEAETWFYEGESVAQNNKAWEKPYAHGASSSVDQESQNDTEATWGHYLHISPNTSHHMEAVLLYGQENLWKRTWRSYEIFECEFGCLGNDHEYHSSSSSSSRKRL